MTTPFTSLKVPRLGQNNFLHKEKSILRAELVFTKSHYKATALWTLGQVKMSSLYCTGCHGVC